MRVPNLYIEGLPPKPPIVGMNIKSEIENLLKGLTGLPNDEKLRQTAQFIIETYTFALMYENCISPKFREVLAQYLCECIQIE